MRRGRRGGHGVLEFGGSGEDSFVAVVVTKLTGALLFILLLSMVIMALIPRAVDPSAPGAVEAGPLEIVTPGRLPEAIAGRPYELAMATSGASGPLRWGLEGELPEGLEFDPGLGLIRGTPEAGSPGPLALTVRVGDGRRTEAKRLSLVVYRPDGPLTVPSPLEAALHLPRVPWQAWGELGFGFLVLVLVHLVAMNGVGAMERRSAALEEARGRGAGRPGRRFALYRASLRVATATAVAVLAGWLWLHRDGPNGGPAGADAAVASAGDDRTHVSR
ncbi:Ig domain-containing protein [Tautonia plasticadhaerens]|uniref:Uncharacterized protein n=1 Tax=Tautonia plasticadhaerens TaxID=2527974 RepID=A0A518H582_9BACT|nr:Ig domain-containing protein [Tautonia plasticadhaerens]QDV35983.1 hypothetical protein ElP_38930 [Tautonia plasticadhaerens]